MSNTQQVRKDVRILRDGEATQLGEEVGAVVFWNAHGNTSHAKLINNWTMAGMDPKLVMDLPSPKVALRRAAQDLQEKNIEAKAFKGRWIIKRIQEAASKDDLDWSTEAKIGLNEAGQLEIEPENCEPALRDEVTTRYKLHLTHLTREDMSQWLVWLAGHVGATALRESGGFYFVPPAGLATWRTISKVIEDSSQYEMQEIPAGRSLSVAKAVLAGLAGEMKTACDEMERDLLSGEHGERALGARVKRCAALIEKIEDYEPVVGRTLNEIRNSVEAIQARLAAAALVTSGTD